MSKRLQVRVADFGHHSRVMVDGDVIEGVTAVRVQVSARDDTKVIVELNFRDCDVDVLPSHTTPEDK